MPRPISAEQTAGDRCNRWARPPEPATRDRRRFPWALGVVVALAVTLVACGGGAPTTTKTGDQPRPAGQASFPVRITSDGGTVRIPAKPVRIVSLSPTATEMLFALGAGRQVKAVDSDSNYPADAPHTNLSAYNPNVEAIAKRNPDLVIISDDINHIQQQLTKLHIPTLLEPAANNLAGTYHQIEQLGQATGQVKGADALVGRMRRRIAALVSQVHHRAKPLTYYFELDPTYYTASSQTFIGRVLALAGLRDIVTGPIAGSNYPQLSAEKIIADDPDMIFLADTLCCHQSQATVAKRPGWSAITAVRDHEVVGLNDNVASRWGPRIVNLLATVVRAVNRAPSR